MHLKNRFTLLLQRILLLFLLYTFCRLLFYLFNFSFYDDVRFLTVVKLFIAGLRFDATAIIISNIVFIGLHFYPFKQFYHKLYQGFLRFLFLLVNSLAVMVNFIDIEFIRFEGKRATTDIFRVMGFGDDFVNTAPRMVLDYWYVLLLLIAVVIALNKLYSRIKITTSKPPTGFFQATVGGQIVSAILILTITVIGFRGGIQYRPINIMTASRYASGKEVSLLLNTPFTILKTIGKSGLEPVNYFPLGEANEIAPVIHHYHSPKPFRKLNVVVIIVESLGKEYIGALNKYPGYTPFLDSLIRKSIVFPNAFANGKRSIEGIPCVIASLPALMDEPFITSSYNGNALTSIASTLRKKGYTTSFFHGGTNGTMGFDNFAKQAGYESYIGRSEYNNDKDFDNNWGIYDEPFLQFAVKKLSAMPQPFHATVFTLSSHHPYLIPPAYANKFRKGTLPIHESISYSDYALKKFFQTASETSWYDSTLFVITGDHTAISEYPYYQSHAGMYAVPIIFYQPSDLKVEMNSTVTEQIDILPGILDYLHYDEPFFSFGNSMFDSTASHVAANYINGVYQLIHDDYALTMDTSAVLGLYRLKTDSLQNNNLKDSLPNIQNSMEKKMRAIVQQFNHSMITNSMHVE